MSDLVTDLENELRDAMAGWERDREALNRAVTALIKISEPGVGGGRWAAAVATEALNSLTCAGEME